MDKEVLDFLSHDSFYVTFIPYQGFYLFKFCISVLLQNLIICKVI
jgi:hypothetical protein